MIDNREEYKSMFEVEQKLWWYQILHERIFFQIKKQFGKVTDLNILDAACGTGGLLSFLKQNGFQRLSGFDYSQHAIAFSKERGLDVSFGDLKNIDDFRQTEFYDVICCSDALYFLDDREIITALEIFKKRLLPNGIILINIHAHKAFAGTHDIAVGSTRRFVLTDFEGYAKDAGLMISYHTYWPFFLSMPIWAVRKWQRYQMRSGRINTAELHSDVSYPGDMMNRILKMITALEEKFLPSAPFGSSLFMVLK